MRPQTSYARAMANQSEKSVLDATGKTWDEWYGILDEAGAGEMTHQQIVAWLYEHAGLHQGWWCQSVTVAYEQRIGRRELGQTCDGDYSAAASRTLAGSPDDVLQRWSGHMLGVREFNGVPLEAEPTTSTTEKWRYWRAKLVDGSRVNVTIGGKGGGQGSDKALLGLGHDKIADKAAADDWKAYWRKVLAEL
jgi:hypothetical protein